MANVFCLSLFYRCDVLEFKLSKSHKKVLKRMNRFLRDGKREKHEEGQGSNNVNDDAKNTDNEDVGDDAGGGGGIREEVQGPNVPLKDINLEVFAKANGEQQTNTKTDKSQAKEIMGKQTANQESSSDSKKCNYFNIYICF